jgi:hypothetical protein
MAVITPTITTSITPVISIALPVQVTGGGVTYSQFLQSLGKYNYGAEYFYLSASTYIEIGQPVYYNHFDANGNSVTTFLPFAVDPYQSQPSLFYETESDQIILTGLSSIQFKVYAQKTVYFKFFATITYLGNELDDINSPSGDNLFEELENREGIKFFDDYCNYLIDNE